MADKQLFLYQKDILSESNLHKAVLAQLITSQFDYSFKEGFYLKGVDISNLFVSWKKIIEQQATKLFKVSHGLLEDLPEGCLYDNLNEPIWKTAAQISELFRQPQISKNAGRLDTKALQKNIYTILTQSESSFNLAIGWGQPKRGAGGLKTIGPYADLAELYTIASLYIIIEAIHKISGHTVKLTVFTGGTRFFEALFTPLALIEQYDQQRQQIANLLKISINSIEFMSYSNIVNGNKQTAITERRKIIFEKLYKNITNDMISTKFETILLNIYWDSLFDPSLCSRQHCPHNIALPVSVDKWLVGKDNLSVQQLIRYSIINLLTNSYQNTIASSFANRTVLTDAATFIRQVAWESSRKYIALHLIDHKANGSLVNLDGKKNLRLTVHEKRDEPEKPAIYTLGRAGGNQLSQHVQLGCLQSGHIVFESQAEFFMRDKIIPIWMTEILDTDVFGWLVKAKQPLAMIETGVIPAQTLIRNIINIR